MHVSAESPPPPPSPGRNNVYRTQSHTKLNGKQIFYLPNHARKVGRAGDDGRDAVCVLCVCVCYARDHNPYAHAGRIRTANGERAGMYLLHRFICRKAYNIVKYTAVY